MKTETVSLVILQLKLLSRQANVVVLVILLGVLGVLGATLLQWMEMDGNLPLLTMVISLFLCGSLFSENVYSSSNERRRYYTTCPNFKGVIRSKVVAAAILLIVIPVPVLIVEISMFDIAMEELVNAFLYLGSALSVFLLIGNVLHWLTLGKWGFVDTLLITGFQSSSIFISSLPYLMTVVGFDNRAALIFVSLVLSVCCWFLITKLSTRLIMHRLVNAIYE